MQLGTDKAPKGNGYEEQLEPLFTFWKDALSLNGRTKFTKGRKTCLRARLREGYEPERIQRAILGCAGSEWHREHGQTDLTLICRNGEKLEQFEARPLPEQNDRSQYDRILNA